MSTVSIVEFGVYGLIAYSSFIMLLTSISKEVPTEKSYAIMRCVMLMPGLICAAVIASTGVNLQTSTDSTNSIIKDLNIKRKKYSASKQTIINQYYQYIYKINNIVDDLELKLIKRFNFKQRGAITAKPRKKGELIFELGFIWNIDENVPTVIFLNDLVQKVENYDKKLKAPEILDAVKEEKSKMDSEHFMFIIGKPEDNFRIYVENLNTKPKKLKKLRKNYAK